MIQVTANQAFMDENPAASTVLDLLRIDLISAATGLQGDVEENAAGWIADNRAPVDAWIEDAKAAAR